MKSVLDFFENNKVQEIQDELNNNAKILLYKDKLVVKTEDDNETIFNTTDICKPYVEFNNTLQFSYNNLKVRMTNKIFPSYVWVTYLNCLIPNS